MMARKKDKKIDYDVSLAINSADTFKAISDAYTKTRKGIKLEDSNKHQVPLGTVIGSATNLSLAVELYLKSIYMLLKKEVPDTHNLWALFKNLPVEVKDELKAQYDLVNGQPTNELASVRIYTARRKEGTFDPPQELRKIGPSDLKSVLVRSAEAYVTWRYLYEHEDTDDWRLFEYEFARLGLVCNVARGYAVHRLGIKNA